MTTIPYTITVKYLGVHLDHLLEFNKHVNTQTQRAAAAFTNNASIFKNKIISTEAKIIF